MNLILLEQHEIDADGLATLTDHRAEHIRTVLKAEPGQSIRVGVIDGPYGTAVAEEITPEAVTMRCALEGRVPPRPSVDLLLALPRPKVMKRLWAQLAAMGVGRIILSNAWKVERNYFDTHVLDPATYRPLLIEGLQQAGDTRLPEVTIHKQFKVLVEDELDGLCPDTIRLVAHPGASCAVRDVLVLAGPLARGPMGGTADAVERVPPESGTGLCSERKLLLAVGPEGGWTDYEIDLLKEHGFQSVGMGDRTLRTDTACVALLAVVHDVLQAG